MVNWKNKYLEMKLKYINAKHQKGGSLFSSAISPKHTVQEDMGLYSANMEKLATEDSMFSSGVSPTSTPRAWQVGDPAPLDENGNPLWWDEQPEQDICPYCNTFPIQFPRRKQGPGAKPARWLETGAPPPTHLTYEDSDNYYFDACCQRCEITKGQLHGEMCWSNMEECYGCQEWYNPRDLYDGYCQLCKSNEIENDFRTGACAGCDKVTIVKSHFCETCYNIQLSRGMNKEPWG